MLALGMGEEEDDIDGVELGFYVGEIWVVMYVPEVHVRVPFLMMAQRAQGGRSGGKVCEPVRASKRLHNMERGEGSSLARRLRP